MNRLFKPKTMRRILLMLALIFPVVYLSGGLFFALNGAHGEQLFAIDGDGTSLNVDMERGIYINLQTGQFSNASQTYCSHVGYYHFDDDLFFNFDTEVVEPYNVRIFYFDENKNFVSYYQYESPKSGLVDVSTGYYFTFSSYIVGSFNLSLTNFSSVGIQYIDSVAYSDYLFSSPFASNNFVSTVGREVMQGTADGFAPMNDLFRTVNDNVLHFDENDALAVFGFGYLYYVVNVIVIYEVVTIALKLLLLPLKVVDKLEVEKDA